MAELTSREMIELVWNRCRAVEQDIAQEEDIPASVAQVIPGILAVMATCAGLQQAAEMATATDDTNHTSLVAAARRCLGWFDDDEYDSKAATDDLRAALERISKAE